MITRPSFGAADDTKVRVLAEPAAFGQNILAARLLCCCSDGCGLLRNSGRFRCRPQGLVYRRAADLNVKFPSNFFFKKIFDEMRQTLGSIPTNPQLDLRRKSNNSGLQFDVPTICRMGWHSASRTQRPWFPAGVWHSVTLRGAMVTVYSGLH